MPLAASARCANQAFAIEYYILALQFHLEVYFQDVERWLMGHSLELTQTGIPVQDLRQHAAKHGAALEAAGEILIRQWLDFTQNTI